MVKVNRWLNWQAFYQAKIKCIVICIENVICENVSEYICTDNLAVYYILNYKYA